MKIQKISAVIILLALFASAFQGCKKGENDPFLSFRSRDARLVGDWDLSAMSDVTTTTNTKPASVFVTTTTYSSGTQTTVSGANNPVISKYNLNLKIEKNGEFSYIYEGFDIKGASTGSVEEKGYWVWGSTAKRKSSIIISVGGPQAAMISGTWNIDQLKNKEIIFKRTTYSKDADIGNTMEVSSDKTMTFTGK